MEHLGYRENKLEKLAEENRRIVREVGYVYDLPENDSRLMRFKENEKILGKYLEENYPNKFNIVDFEFEEVEPNFNFNIDWEDMVDGENSQTLEESSDKIKNIWKEVIKRGYKPQIHDIISIYFLNIQDRYYSGLVFFIDDDGIYLASGHFNAPDVFYDLLERLGLGEDFNKYIYKESGAWFRKNKWPYVAGYKERIK